MTTHTPYDRTFDYGLRALAEVTRYKTSAEPMAYELWYSHVSGQHRELSAALRTRSERGGISDLDIEEMHAEHLSSLRVSTAAAVAAAAAGSEMRDLLASVRQAIGDVSNSDDQLRAAADRLDRITLDGAGLRDAIALVAAAAKDISSSNKNLQNRLQQSEANIASLQATLDRTRAEAMTDGLTGLLNRRAFDEQLALQVESAVAYHTPLSLLMLDIDHFKRFNDLHGHQVGDQVLRLVASGIRQKLEPTYVATRYGGEEFAVIGCGRTIAEAVSIAEAIRSQLADYNIVQQGTTRALGRVTISIGAATLHEGESALSLVERADRCLYVAKRAGRNRVEAEDRA